MFIPGERSTNIPDIFAAAFYECFANVEHYVRNFVSGFFQRMKQKSRVFFKCWAFKKTSDKFVEVSKRLIW